MPFARSDFLFVLTSQEPKAEIENLCRDGGWSCEVATNPESAQEALVRDVFKVVWIEIDDAAPSGLQILEWMQTRNFGCDTGVLFSKGHDPQVLRSLTLQNQNFFYKPVLQRRDLAQAVLARSLIAFERAREKRFFKVEGKRSNPVWVQASPATQSMLQRAQDFARAGLPWVIEGPAGSGKSHLIDCAYAMSQNRILWDTRSVPLFAQKEHFLKLGPQNGAADQVWIIQDIGNLDMELQEIVAEFLKGQGWLAGTERSWPAAYVVLTTSEPLSELLQAQKLREDLYHLVKGRVIHFPHLQYRSEDVAAFAEYALLALAGEQKPKRLTSDALEILQNYEWPGEVAELVKTIQDLHASVADDWIEVRHLPHELLEKNIYSILDEDENLWALPYQEAKKRTLHKFNRAYMKHLLDDSDQNYTVAAEKAGMDRSNFKKLLKKI